MATISGCRSNTAAIENLASGTLSYGAGIEFKSGIPIYSKWDYKHAPPGVSDPLIALPNVLPDLAVAMKQNPDMKVMVNGGLFDISTPYFEGKMEMRHLPVPQALRGNIEYRYYESGHMVYAHLPSLVALHVLGLDDHAAVGEDRRERGEDHAGQHRRAAGDVGRDGDRRHQLDLGLFQAIRRSPSRSSTIRKATWSAAAWA